MEALVRTDDRNAAGNGRRIRKLLERDRDTFYSCAIDILRSQARHLSESLAVGGKPAADVTRLMAILSEISSGNRILPTLMSLARQQNKHFQSKAVLMIGKANRSVKWVQTRLSDPDSRVAGNALLGL